MKGVWRFKGGRGLDGAAGVAGMVGRALVMGGILVAVPSAAQDAAVEPSAPIAPDRTAEEAPGDPAGATADKPEDAIADETAGQETEAHGVGGEVVAVPQPETQEAQEAQEASAAPAVRDVETAATLEVPTLDPEPSKQPPRAGPFAQGNVRLGGSLGWASSFGGGESVSWFIVGLGAGYFPIDGLEVHGDVTTWIGDPFIATLTPGVRYVFYQVPTVKPYLGVMYRHYFVAGSLPDTDSIGARVGLNFMVSPKSYFGGGVMIEHFLDQNVFSESPQVYPELVFSLML